MDGFRGFLTRAEGEILQYFQEAVACELSGFYDVVRAFKPLETDSSNDVKQEILAA